MARDRQSALSKQEQRNEQLDREQEEGYNRYLAEERRQAEENAAPRKALGEAFDYVKNKASNFASDLGKGMRNYGRTYQEGLGMKPSTPYEKKKGGVIKTASSRADGIAQRGKTRGKIY